jgi:hypothetical protein
MWTVVRSRNAVFSCVPAEVFFDICGVDCILALLHGFGPARSSLNTGDRAVTKLQVQLSCDHAILVF